MRLESNPTVGKLVSALPSSAGVFSKFGLPISGNENRSIQDLCKAHNVNFNDFLRAIEQIDWGDESPSFWNSKDK